MHTHYEQKCMQHATYLNIRMSYSTPKANGIIMKNKTSNGKYILKNFMHFCNSPKSIKKICYKGYSYKYVHK